MKKVRIMLASIAILAVIGGSLAFKAKKAFNSPIFYTTAPTTVGVNASIQAALGEPGFSFVGKTYYYTVGVTSTSVFPTSTYITVPGGE